MKRVQINLEVLHMIQKYVSGLAEEMGISLSRVSVVEGRNVGCLSVHLVHLGTKDKLVSALVHQSELNDLHNAVSCDRLELKMRAALSRLGSTSGI